MKNPLLKASVSVLIFMVLALSIQSCGKKDSANADIEEAGQQVGDVMASIDESGGSLGTIAANPELNSTNRLFARLRPMELKESFWVELYRRAVIPSAEATSCLLANTFSTCTNNVVTRTFGGCTISLASFNGTVALTWTDDAVDNTCLMTSAGHSITRVPDFTVTGRRGATLSVSKSGSVGQRLTKSTSTGAFVFSNDGIRRVFTAPNGSTLFDFTTQTTSDIAVSGASRAGRVLTGGGLRVTNNLTGVSCDLMPNTVTWQLGCNCPKSGSWAGTCSDGKSFSVSLTGCGTADLTVGSDSTSIIFDRCYGS